MIIIELLALCVVFATFASLIPRDEWWFRGFDFPRLQILALGVLVWFVLLLWSAPWTMWRMGCAVLLSAALIYQLRMVLPYTVLWRKQVKKVQKATPMQQISLLVSNVLTPNRKQHLLIAHIRRLQPDVVLTLETDIVWEQALSSIEKDYPYVVRVPQDNLYGMHLYSRLPLSDTQVKFMLSDEIPSIHTQVTLRSGQQVQLYCLHPKPPSPTEAKTSTLRDAELLMVGEALRPLDQTCIVMGDLNDVAWSRTTRLFQKISGLLDPRIGRHFMNTFHADYPMLRWSLDHVFHSRDFALVDIQRLTHIGSDHFPVFTVLQCGQKYVAQQPVATVDADDKEEAQDKIEKGLAQVRTDVPLHEVKNTPERA